MKYEDLTGKKFNRLTVVGISETRLSNNRFVAWDCICDCGGTKIATRYHLTKGAVTSCGCVSTLNTEKFVEASRDLHGDVYNYDSTIYTGYQDFVEIGCKIHGKFEQRAAIHLSGSGCQECAHKRMGEKHVIPEEDFICKAVAKYGDKFDYSDLHYTKSTAKAKITCNKHGHSFWQKPTHHLMNVGEPCRKCSSKMHGKEDFIVKANSVHGEGTFDYSLVDYVGSKKKVTIVCKEGHRFDQTPHNHTAGKHGCPTCGKCGYSTHKEGSLYVLSADNIVKVGITNRTASKRLNTINKTSNKNFSVEVEYRMDGKTCSDLEDELLLLLRKDYNNPPEKFDGSTECFVGVDKEWLLNLVASRVKDYNG